MKIILTTINASYIHTAIGLRYLYANLHEYQHMTCIQEFDTQSNLQDSTEKLLADNPLIIGIGVYIWNARHVHDLVNLLKKTAPGVVIVLGGPEVSHMPFRVDFSAADYIIQGEGESSFYLLCRQILDGTSPVDQIIPAQILDVQKYLLPYIFYNDEDIKNRVIYVEASRGCPFKCSFCLSAIDRSVRYFDIEKILSALELLWQRGARKFKFVDRTFNLNTDVSLQILNFFLQKTPPYLVHFEMIPDNFPDELKEKIRQFPPASVQLEIGLQTLNENIALNINRVLNFEAIQSNLTFLEDETHAHLHVDLIIGLPGESIDSFGENLDRLVQITSAEVQLGILKKLSGTEISKHDTRYGMTYSDIPPYDILLNDLISFNEMQMMKRFSRFWELYYNSGNFNESVRLLWISDSVFKSFFDFSVWIFDQTQSTWQISLSRLAELIFCYLTDLKGMDHVFVADTIGADIMKISGRKLPSFLRSFVSKVPETHSLRQKDMNKRQIRRI
ncbi:DUF4080 domain-containing protein [bacterium]|nr:DUF4080 domain-containing protein [bacterium]